MVAEGVETAEIAVLMEEMGIDLLQGYCFAKPLTEEELVGFVGEAGTSGEHTPTVGRAGRMITRIEAGENRSYHPQHFPVSDSPVPPVSGWDPG